MKLLHVIIFNAFLIVIFTVNIIYMLIKFFYDIKYEQVSYKGQEDKGNEDYTETDSDPIIHDQLSVLRKKFYISFVLVELSLIAFFIFWGIVFYYRIEFI